MNGATQSAVVGSLECCGAENCAALRVRCGPAISGLVALNGRCRVTAARSLSQLSGGVAAADKQHDANQRDEGVGIVERYGTAERCYREKHCSLVHIRNLRKVNP